jgi:hypothetical protein
MASHPIQLGKVRIHILKTSLAKMARASRMSSQPSQPPKAHIHILKLANIERARLSEMASHPSQLGKARIHILKTSLAENGESIKNVKSTMSTTEGANTNSETNPGRDS